MKKEIICTIGPSSRNKRVITRLDELGVSLFRINLSHTKTKDVAEVIKSIQAHTNVPICLDTEGAQIRTGGLLNGHVIVTDGAIIRITRHEVNGTDKEFNFTPSEIVNSLEVGDMINIDFNHVLVQVVEKDNDGVLVYVLVGGVLGQNKAVSVDRDIKMPPLTHGDYEAIKVGMQVGIQHVALSFANCGEDVDKVRSIIGMNRFLISKIESLNGIKNFEAIAGKSNALLLDRGDMSRNVAIEQIPHIQKELIRRSLKYPAKFYVATNLLESMITSSSPTRAEVNDIFNTLNDGADGLVLAAETAIGAYPIQCASMVARVIQRFEAFKNDSSISVERLSNENSILLGEPHGGSLVQCFCSDDNLGQVQKLKKIEVDLTSMLDVEQIALGTFSPLQGFMTKDEVKSVLDTYKLPSGVVWPLPITLQVREDQWQNVQAGDVVALSLNGGDEIYAIMDIEDCYKFDLNRIAKKMFGTNEISHPGVRKLMQKGDNFLGGKISLVKRLPSQHKHYEMTPWQVRTIFENKGWSRIVGFHTRNVAHRVHEHIQLAAFEEHHCDGIFIHPLVGPKKQGDYSGEIVLNSYQMMVDKYYPKGSMLVAAFQSYPRYSGPREAVFTAICRKNFGCSHFVVGRDHSGVGEFYEPDGAKKLFESLGDFGIKPIFFNEINYCQRCDKYIDNCEHDESDVLRISGTQGREMLMEGRLPPQWFMRREIANMILQNMSEGKDVFWK